MRSYLMERQHGMLWAVPIYTKSNVTQYQQFWIQKNMAIIDNVTKNSPTQFLLRSARIQLKQRSKQSQRDKNDQVNYLACCFRISA